jgi:hypothetical protein
VEDGVKDQVVNASLLGSGDHAPTDCDLVWVDIGAYVIHGARVLNGAAQICGESHIGRHHLDCPEFGQLFELGRAPNQGARWRAGVG